jgi:alpha-1,3-mannosyltransferase
MEDVVRNITRHQLAAGHTPVVITLDHLFASPQESLPPADEVDGVPVRRLSFTGSPRYPLCPRVLGPVAGADVVHVHGVDFFFDFFAATRWLHRRRLVASTHGGFFHTRFAARLKRLFFHTVTRGSARAYARIIATSHNDGRIFQPVVGTPRLAVIENGVDVRKFHDRAAPAPTATLIYFGRWSLNKGIPEAIDLLARLRRRDPAWRLIIAGREYDYNAAQLHSLLAERGLQDAAEVVPNPDDEELARLIEQASYFVCMSWHEGFGLAAVEAMSAGLQPVLSDIPPFRSLVERSGLGVMVRGGWEDDAVEWLLASYHEASDAYPARRAAAIEFSAPYDWNRVADRYLDVYSAIGARQ